MTALLLLALAAEPTPAEQATPAANAALAAAYAKFATRKDAVAPAHPEPWVKPENAVVTGSAKKGFVVSWTSVATAGFEFQVKVSVTAKGVVKVLEASAHFSPD